MLRFGTFGESHGKSIGCILEGVPSNICLSEEDIQPYLDKRRPGNSKFTTQRSESDSIEILSGVFEGKTTGTPIGMRIVNKDQRSKDYGDIAHTYRPGHADYVYAKKYAIRDYRGGGRSSARETAMRVAMGSVARKILGDGVRIVASIVELGGIPIDYNNYDENYIHENDFYCADKIAVPKFEDMLLQVRKLGDSVGGIVEVRVTGISLGLGEPVYDKLDADLAKALMSINAVKGVEFGSGFQSARMLGSENNDQMTITPQDEVHFLSNNAGGILGGISTGQDLSMRIAFKPTPSILKEQQTITDKNQPTTIRTKGRHDPCVAIRGVPVAEAMVALTLADHLLRFQAYANR